VEAANRGQDGVARTPLSVSEGCGGGGGGWGSGGGVRGGGGVWEGAKEGVLEGVLEEGEEKEGWSPASW
jgi:hypothetical protein